MILQLEAHLVLLKPGLVGRSASVSATDSVRHGLSAVPRAQRGSALN